MALELIQIRELAERKEDENSRFRQFLKTRCNLEPDEIDRRVFETTRRVWAGIDCTTCANRCREMKPTLSEEEVERVKRRLGMERQQFIETYLERSEADSENPWQTRAAPCPFLKDNLCTIYEDRPAECSGYPCLYKPDFIFRTMGMIQRTFSCPIVYEVTEELNSLGFLRTALQPHIKGGKRKTTAPVAYRTQDGKGTTTNSGTNPYGDHNRQVRLPEAHYCLTANLCVSW